MNEITPAQTAWILIFIIIFLVITNYILCYLFNRERLKIEDMEKEQQKNSENSENVYCSYCGYSINITNKHCPECGTKVIKFISN